MEERLDRAMSTASWMTLFPSASLSNMVASMSDHSPISLKPCSRDSEVYGRKFRFENSWLLEEGLDSVVMESCAKGDYGDVLNKLQECTENLDRWGRKLKTRFSHDITSCKREIANLLYNHDLDSEAELCAARHKLGVLLMQEENFRL